MCKLYVGMPQRKCLLLRKFFEANYNMFGWRFRPGAFGNKFGAHILEFRIFKNTAGTSFDVDGVAGVNKGFCGGGGKGGPVLKRFGLGSQMQDGVVHVEKSLLFGAEKSILEIRGRSSA